MNRPSISVSPDFLHSRLIPAAAIAYILSAVTGLAGVLFLLLPGSGQTMMQDMFMGGITDRSALMTWQVINIAITVICFLWAVMMSLCLIGSLTGRAGKGLNLVYHSSRICVKVLDIAGICALALLVYKLAAYIIRNFNLNDWLYLVYAMLISEALMVVMADSGWAGSSALKPAAARAPVISRLAPALLSLAARLSQVQTRESIRR